MKKLQEHLLAFGLNANESKVYMSVFRLGDCSIGALEKETALHRQLIYNAANSLSLRGLLSIKRLGGRRRFTAAPPSTFSEIYEKGRQNVAALVRELDVEKKTSKFSGEAKLYRGNNEVHQYYLNSIAYQPIRSRVDILGIESSRFFKIFSDDQQMYKRMEELRISRKITWNILLSSSKEKELDLNQSRPLLNCRLMRNQIAAPFDIVVWRDHVGLLIYGDNVTVLDIPGDPVARGFRKYSSVLWDQGTEVIRYVSK